MQVRTCEPFRVCAARARIAVSAVFESFPLLHALEPSQTRRCRILQSPACQCMHVALPMHDILVATPSRSNGSPE